MRGAFIRRAAICAVAIGFIFISQNVFAQSGSVKGKVVDAQGNPVEGAEVDILSIDKGGKPLVVKTKKDGTYMQVGLSPGEYKITATKGNLSSSENAHVSLDVKNVDLKLAASGGGRGAPNPKLVAAQKAFDEGVQLSSDTTKSDEAIAKFQEAITSLAPAPCAECYSNIGTLQVKKAAQDKEPDAQKKDFDDAEASYKKAIELKPEMADAYNGLATLYNAQRKFDQAAEASKKALELSGSATGASGAAAGAAGGASAGAVYNQGVILWNAGKTAEAKAQFEQAVKLDPNNADAHYWLGMALVNGGDTANAKPQFEAYLKLSPSGQYADTAKAVLASIK